MDAALIKQLAQQSRVAQVLEIEIEKRKNFFDSVGRFADDYINALPEAKSFIDKPVAEDRLSIAEQGNQLEDLLAIFRDEVTETGLRAASGGHVGYIPGGGLYAAALGDFLAAVSNEYAGVSYASPGAVAIENAVLDWLKKVFNFPKTAVGNLTSGGSMANLIALAAARDKYGIKNERITKSVIYLSSQVHHCVTKALRIIGLEDVLVRYVALDKTFKIKPDALSAQIENDKAEGLNPFLVIASAGTTDVGAVDPLFEIGKITRKNNLWFHVDAAYGGFFILTSRKGLFRGIENADSLVVDPHKGMFLPYGIGAVLVKDAQAVLKANHYTANYMQDAVLEDLTKDPANVSPELTKHFRGLRIWLPLQLHGIKPFVACLEEKLLLTRYFREGLQTLGFHVGSEPDLSVSYFWYPFEKDENAFNETLMRHIHEDGRVFLSSTLLHKKFVIRMAILSFRTHKATIDKALEMVSDCLEQTKADFA